MKPHYFIRIKSGIYTGKSGIGIIENYQAGIFLDNEHILTWFPIDRCEIIKELQIK